MLVLKFGVLDDYCELPLVLLQTQQQFEEGREDLVLACSIVVGE